MTGVQEAVSKLMLRTCCDLRICDVNDKMKSC